MISLRKRGAVYGVIGLMLCVAVYLNWSYFQTPDELTIADQAEASGRCILRRFCEENAENRLFRAGAIVAGDRTG